MQDAFHLVSTPIPILPNLGLETQVGLTSEDPMARRNIGMSFNVWVTVYGASGQARRRWQIGHLAAGDRAFYDLSTLVAEYTLGEPHLCVVHRVPDGLPLVNGTIHVPNDFEADFDMYRSVVQYVHPRGGRGSVIYETPPGLNGDPRKRGTFLSHSNQILVGAGTNSYLVVVNYSVDAGYDSAASLYVTVYDPDGRMVRKGQFSVAPFGVATVDFGELTATMSDADLRQYSYVACSTEAALIPLIINLNADLGGVSVEHTHPPNAYMALPGPDSAKIRADALMHAVRSDV